MSVSIGNLIAQITADHSQMRQALGQVSGGVVHCTQVFKDRVISEPIGPLEVGTGLSLVKSKRKKIKKTFGKNKK